MEQPPQLYDETLDPSCHPFENPNESGDYSFETPQKHNENSSDSDSSYEKTSQEDDESKDFYYEIAEKDDNDQEPAHDEKTHQEHDESSEDYEYSDDELYYYYSSDDELYYPIESVNRFESVYRCYPLSFIEKTRLECGDKIVMPEESLRRLLDKHIDYPMRFQIQNQTTGQVSHCGVYEFTGDDEGSVFLPNWMMENLELQVGDSVNIKNASLEKGTYMKLQPHTMDFMGIKNPKDMLEETFRSFSCLTVGDTIVISHESKKFYINIVETKPSNAISIIDTDCEVDFALPLDYKEPEKPAPKIALAKDPEVPIEEPKFIPFTGVARRLDGKPLAAPITSVQNELSSVAADGGSKATGLKFTPQKKSNELETEDVKAQTSKEQRFQPFTGKKYTLTG